MITSIESGSIIISPSEALMLYQVARLGELRSKYRVGDTTVYRLLTQISECAFTTPLAANGNQPRQETASEERGSWTVQQVARAAGLSARTVRLDCQHGDLPSIKHGSTWNITHSAAQTYIAARKRSKGAQA